VLLKQSPVKEGGGVKGASLGWASPGLCSWQLCKPGTHTYLLLVSTMYEPGMMYEQSCEQCMNRIASPLCLMSTVVAATFTAALLLLCPAPTPPTPS
jgi:hypothetical protein